MISFFRKIRKQLADDNKPLKYFRYAIGEIVLVVIGILIALSINNWNEERKDRKVEFKILQELHDVLLGSVFQGELSFQKDQLEQNKKSKASGEILINYIENKLPFHDSLKFHFANNHTRFVALAKVHAYENAKKFGLDFIINDSLKELLTWTYETNSIWLNELNERNNLYENSTVFPLLTVLFEAINTGDYETETKSMTPINYDELKENKAYLNILKTTVQKRKEYILFQNRRYQRMLELAKLLEREIKSRSS